MARPAHAMETMTFEEASRLDPDEQAGELDRGRWVAVTKNTWRHGKFVGNAYAMLRAYAQSHPGWSVAVGDPGTKLSHEPDVLRGPDVGIVRVEREPQGRGSDGWLEGAPDVAVEVAGDAQSASLLERKASEYLRAGGRMVLVVDPESQGVKVFTPDRVQILSRDEKLDGGDVLPGFTCRVGEFFE